MGKNGRGGGSVSGSSNGRRSHYTVVATDYKLLEEVGNGASATVYRAIFVPTNEVIAVKCLDLDRCNSNLDDIRREAQTMSLIDHPYVISAHCSFVVEHCLWVVMPFMAEGSCLHLMKIAYPDGFEEAVIRYILKETLLALEYLHSHGHIHRDVKAGNILLDSTGMVKLGDFGVSAFMFDNGDRRRSRNTFVGTPCWMAPEVLQPGSGYNFKADIWSFGITALELAHGHAPFSKYPPMKVLLMTLQNAPPGLDYDRDKKFSKSFKEMVAMCLVKDQRERPTAEKLLRHSFFKSVKPPEHPFKKILADLPPLWDRVKALQLKDAAQLVLKKMPSGEQEALSQSEYQRGVSAWNFDVDDLEYQASLIKDDKDVSEVKEDNGSMTQYTNNKDPCTSGSSCGKPLCTNEIDFRKNNCNVERRDSGRSGTKDELLETDPSDSNNQEALEEYEKSRSKNGPTASTSKQAIEPNNWKSQMGKKHHTYSGPLVPSSVHNTSVAERRHISERSEAENQLATDKSKRDVRKSPNLSGPLMLPKRASANSLSAPSSGGCRNSLDDKSKANVVEIRGRFSVTSENVDLVKDIPLCTAPRRSSPGSPLKKSASVGDWLVLSKQVSVNQYAKETTNSSVPAAVLMPHLQNLLQQNSFQQDFIMNLVNSLQQIDLVDNLQTGIPSQNHSAENDIMAETASTERERLLLMKVAELQSRMISLTDELTAAKLKHIQLQEELNAYRQEEDMREQEMEEI